MFETNGDRQQQIIVRRRSVRDHRGDDTRNAAAAKRVRQQQRVNQRPKAASRGPHRTAAMRAEPVKAQELALRQAQGA